MLVVNYDSETNKFSSILQNFKKRSGLNDNTKEFISQINKGNFDNVFDLANSIGKVDRTFIELGQDVANGAMTLKDFNAIAESASNTSSRFSSILSGIGGIAKTVGSAALNMAAAWAISEVISLAVKGIYNFVHANEIAIENGEKAQSAIKDAFDSYNTKINSITDISKKYADETTQINTTADAVSNLANRYSELHKGVSSDNTNASLSNNQYQEYLDISNQLADIFPSIYAGLDSNGNSLLNLGNNASTASEQLQQVIEDEKTLANVKIGESINDSFKGAFAQSKEYSKQKEKYKQNTIEDQLDNGTIELNPTKLGTKVSLDYQKKLIKAMKKHNISYDQYSNEASIDINTGEMVEGNFGFSNIKGTAENIKKLKQEIQNLGLETSKVNYEADKQLQALELKQKDTWQSFINDSVKPYLETSSAITNVPTELTNAVENNLSNIDWSDLYSKYNGDAKEMLNNQFVIPLQNLSKPAQEALSNALKIDPSKMSIDEYEKSIDDALKSISKDKDERAKWKDLFFQNQLDEATEKAEQLKKKFTDNKKEIDKLSGEDRDIAYKIAFEDDGFDGKYDELVGKIKTLKEESSNPITFNAQTFLSDAQQALAQIDTLNAAIADSFSGKGLNVSFETDDDGVISLSGDIQNIISAYKDLEGYDPAVLFEKTANGVRINQQALRELQSQLESKTKADWLKDEQNLTSRLADATKKLNEAKASGNETDITSAQTTVDSLQSQLETVQLLSSAYEGATSAYQKWLNVQSAGEEGDMYRNVSETMRERGQKLYEEGRYNTNEFRAIANYYSNEDLSTAPVEKLVAAYQNAQPYVEKFFTGNKEGLDNFLISLKEISDSEGLNWIEELGDGSLKFNFDDEEVAKRFHLSTEAIQALVRGMQEYMDVQVGSKDGVQDFNQSIDEMRSKADEAKQHLKELSTNGNIELEFNFNSTNLDDLNSQIEKAKSNLDTFRNDDGSLNINADGCSDAITILQTLIQQKQLVSQPEIMTIDTSGLDDGVANAVSKLQEYQNALNELNTLSQLKEVGVPVDDSQISEAQSKVDNLFSEIQGMSQNGELKINADVSVDSSSKDSLQASLDSMTPEIKAKIIPDGDSSISNLNTSPISTTVNYTKGQQELPEDKSAKVNYTKGQQYKAENRNAKVNYTKGSQENPKSPVTATVNYALGTVAKPGEVTVKVNYDTSGKPHKYNGTANAIGSARAFGDWSVGKNETSLVGELGRETIVRNGRYFTVGDKGAEFVSLRPNDIVFNHKQTEELFKNGHVISNGGRARLVGESYAFGSAFSSGSPWRLGNIGNGNISSPTNYHSTPTVSSNNNTSQTNNNSSSNSSAEKATENLVDFIKILYDRVSRFADLAEKAIDRAVGLVNKQAQATDAIDKVRTELSTAQRAADKYFALAKNVELADDYKRKIREGNLSIENITDENTKDAISKYQSYWESYQEYSDKTLDLQDKLTDLAEKRLSIIEDEYDALTEINDAIKDVADSKMELNNALGVAIDNSANFDAIKESIKVQEDTYAQLTKKLNAYQAEISSQLSSGLLKEGSESYRNAMKNVQDFTANIYKASKELIELQDKLTQIRIDSIQYIIDGLSRRSDKVDKYTAVLEAGDKTVPENIYQERLDNNNAIIKKNQEARAIWLERQATEDVGSENYQKYAEEIQKLDESTLDLIKDNESLKDSIYSLRIKNLEDAIQKYADLEDELSAFRDLLNDDAFLDKQGGITDEGLAQITLLSQSLGNAKQKIADQTTGLQKLKKLYENNVISLDEYNEKSKEYRDGIQASTKDVKSYQDSLTDLYMKAMQTEVDYLDKIAKKHQEALDKKKSYYEYDKKIKSQNKDINSLKAQYEAIKNSNNLADKARAKQLAAQIKEKEEELADTKRDHEYDMRSQGYDKLSEELSEMLENTEYEISHNADKQTEIINNMLNKQIGMYQEAYNKINSIIGNTGWVGSTDFNNNQSQMSTQSGATAQKNNASQSQSSSNQNPSTSASGTITSGIKDNSYENNKITEDIMKPENLTNRLCAELKVDKSSVTLEEGKFVKVNVTIRPNDAKNKTLSWGTSNSSIATASDGTISAKAPGSCQIVVATTDGSGLTQTISVTVTKKPEPPKPQPKPSNTGGGDGIPRVGDVVTYTGSYFYDSWGVTPLGNMYSGVPNGVVIDGYSSSEFGGSATRTGDFKVHIKSADGRYGDLGWVRLNQISGYSTGTKGIDKSFELAKIDEQGKELRIKRGGDVYDMFQYGDAVVPKQLTDNLFTLAEHKNDLLSSVVSRNTNVGDAKIENNYGSLLTVNGNVDKDALPELKEIIKQSYDYAKKELAKELRSDGFRIRR